MPENKFKKIALNLKQYVLLLIFLTLLAILMIFEANRLVIDKINQLKERESQEIALENRIKNLDKLEKDYLAISPDVDYINNLLPSKDKIIDLLSKIENIAEKNNVEISVKFEGEAKDHKLKAKYTIKGFYNDVMNFYKAISAGDDVIVYIKTLNLSDNNNLLDNTKATMETEVYFD